MLHQVRLPRQRVAAVAAAATGYNPCPGSKPLANHVPRGCNNPFLTLTLINTHMLYNSYINLNVYNVILI